VVKGGKIMGFRCVAVVGDGKGRVGVGCQAGREVGTAVKRALVDAKKVRLAGCGRMLAGGSRGVLGLSWGCFWKVGTVGLDWCFIDSWGTPPVCA
jgi:hypothetical protein